MNAAAIMMLAEKGLSALEIAEFAALLEKPRDRTGAERQARYRDRHKVTRDVTRDPSPNERDNLTPTREIPPKPNGLDPKAKKHRLPIDWEPQPFKPGSMAALTIIRWEPGRMERELAKFRDHHTAAGTKWENWQAAWSKWVNNSDDFQRGRSGLQQPTIGKSAAAFEALTRDFADDQPF